MSTFHRLAAPYAMVEYDGQEGMMYPLTEDAWVFIPCAAHRPPRILNLRGAEDESAPTGEAQGRLAQMAVWEAHMRRAGCTSHHPTGLPPSQARGKL